jgi:hypothetical protein
MADPSDKTLVNVGPLMHEHLNGLSLAAWGLYAQMQAWDGAFIFEDNQEAFDELESAGLAESGLAKAILSPAEPDKD